MAKARFSYVPNVPMPGEAELALGTANNPVAGIHLLNAQMERRFALDQHNATMEQIMQSQNEQAKQAGLLEMAKVVANASNPYAQAPLAMQQFPGAVDEITQLQAQEQRAIQAENFQKIASGIHSALQGGVSTGPDPLAAAGLPGNFTNVPALDLQKQSMSDANDLAVARIGADATLGAAKIRGTEGGGGTKPQVTLSPYVPGLGPLQMRGGSVADVMSMNNDLSKLLGQDVGGSPVEAEMMKSVMPQLEAAAAQNGMTVPPGSVPKKVTRGGREVIVLPTVNQDGTPGEIVGEL